MAKFSKKKLEKTKTLGERLQKIREEAGLTIDQVSKDIQIQKRYLQALEQGNYSLLPGPVYVESFLKKYAEYLGVSVEFVLSLYHQQEKKTLKKDYQSKFSPTPKELPKSLITPVLVKRLLIAIVILVLVFYVGFEIAKIFSPPELVVETPQDYITVDQNTIKVVGHTELSATLTINGKEIFLEDDGSFAEKVTLKEGVNNISVSATKEKSEANIIIRRVIYEKNN